MTISELIQIMQELQEKYGNLPVYVIEDGDSLGEYGDIDVCIDLNGSEDVSRYISLT